VCLGSSWRLGLARVFTIVNVMLGSSLLVFPWAFAGRCVGVCVHIHVCVCSWCECLRL